MTRAIPFSLLSMAKLIFGEEFELAFLPIPLRQRVARHGHRCMAQVMVRVGPDPGDRHFYSASGHDCLAALQRLLLQGPKEI